MRRHYVLWKFKEGVTEEQIDTAFAQAMTMDGQIEGMLAIRTGKNQAGRNSAGYTHFLEVLFRDAEAHEHYNQHPLHRTIARTQTIPLTERVAALDFDEPDRSTP
jgi:hypothetical protein